MAFGYHLMLDMYDCTGAAFSSFDLCYAFLERLSDLLEMTRQAPPYLFRSDAARFPDKAGFSGWLPLIESGIQIHTIEPVRFVSLDVYSCRAYDTQAVIAFAASEFSPAWLEHQFVERGKTYPRA